MAAPKVGSSQSANTCSVCLELINATHERSTAKLICGHQFHLDCIGSAFNAKGSMQCPNCRQIEDGDWLYGNGRPHSEDSISEEMMFEDDYDEQYNLFAGVSRRIFPEDLVNSNSDWCPYQGFYTHLSLSLGNGDHHPVAYAEVLLDVLVSESSESTEFAQPSTFVLAQAAASNRYEPGVENAGLLASNAHPRSGARYRRRLSPFIGEWHRQSPAVPEPNSDIGLQEGSRWPQSENESAGYIWPPQQSRHNNGRRQRSSASTPAGADIPTNQFPSRPARWDYPGTSAAQDTPRDAQPRGFTNFRQQRRQGRSRFGQYTSEPEGQHGAPPPSLGSYAPHGIHGSELPTQVGILDQRAHTTSQARHLYPSAEDLDVQPSRSFHHPR